MKRLALLAGLVVLGYFIFSLAGLALQSYQLSQRAAAVEDDIVRLKAENERLRAQVDGLQTPAAVEPLARQQLGFVKEGETAVVVDFGPAGRPREVPTPTPASVPYSQQWWDLLFGP